MEFVFIIGVARTGSKIYRNSISGFTDIDILNETHFLSPRWIRKDFCRSVSEAVGNSLTAEDLDSVLDIMYRKTLEGTFWRMGLEQLAGNENCIQELDRETLKGRLRATDLSFKAILETVMRMHAEERGKGRGGAKFPANVSCFRKFHQWFPDSRYLHITRDPRAVYGSMILMDRRDRGSRPVRRFSAAKRLAYLVHQFRWSARVHTMMAESEQYRLVRFEDTVIEPTEQMSRLCDFLSVSFDQGMLSPRLEDSSFGKQEARRGFDVEALDRWRNVVSARAEKIIRTFLGDEMRILGY